VVVPLFNEEDSVIPLHEALVKALSPLGFRYEIIFVDDGSRDGTFGKARDMAAHDTSLRVIKFRRNYGQTPAMAAGIEHARGRVIVTMDGDLQNDPSDIPRFVEKIEEGYDIVCGWRYRRQDRLITRRIPSVVANRLIGAVTGIPIRDNGCSLKAYRADIIKSVPLYSDMHRFIPAMTSLAGTRVAEIKVNHRPRLHGISKYGLSRIYKVFIDLMVVKSIISFSTRPLQMFAIGSMVSSAAAIALVLVSLADAAYRGGAFDLMIASSSVLFLALAFFLILLGLFCELVVGTGHHRELSHVNKRID
jgi:glycosyltransferase involved in cell wall biosynthesis